ncbi:MAG: hypothetical protein R3D30_08360 [Hyphomicrobiales bacterium]
MSSSLAWRELVLHHPETRWGGRCLTVDLNPPAVLQAELARAFARALWELCQISGSIGAVTTAKQYVYSVTGSSTISR